MPVYAIVGERARLRCGIQPGALTGQYYATWLNGTRTIYNYPAPSQRLADPSSQMTVDSRYSIDPSDLSLIITNVQLGDALQMYHCELGVEDPRSRNTHIYSLTRSHNISLKVLSKYTKCFYWIVLNTLEHHMECYIAIILCVESFQELRYRESYSDFNTDIYSLQLF